MKVNVKLDSLQQHKTDALVLGLFEEEKLSSKLKSIDSALNNEITELLKNEFKAEFNQLKLINTHRRLPANKILLVGLGKQKELTTEKLRKSSAITAKYLRDQGLKTFTTTLHSIKIEGKTNDETVKAVVEGNILGLYDFKKYITVDKDKIKKVDEVTLLEEDKNKVNLVERAVRKAGIIANNVNYVRDLVNEPAELVTPTYLADEAMNLAKSSKGKIKVKVFEKKDIVKLGMGGLLAVSKGSSQEPRFIILEYGNVKDHPIIFVGKGITFDAGGLNIKPTNYIEDMRSDMAGAATVLATLKTAYELGLSRNIVVLIPSCENLLGCSAFKPGDILKSYNGKTIEIWNTDAEGRLVLADALGYAEKNYKPNAILDIATLTGASIIALGYEIVSLMSTDEKLKQKYLEASKKADEMTWELPLFEDYKDLVKGDAGDVRNTSKDGMGPGTITAGLFLNNFVEKTPWIHLDIGASGWAPKDQAYKKKGGTGVCLRTFIQLIEDW